MAKKEKRGAVEETEILEDSELESADEEDPSVDPRREADPKVVSSKGPETPEVEVGFMAMSMTGMRRSRDGKDFYPEPAFYPGVPSKAQLEDKYLSIGMVGPMPDGVEIHTDVDRRVHLAILQRQEELKTLSKEAGIEMETKSKTEKPQY